MKVWGWAIQGDSLSTLPVCVSESMYLSCCDSEDTLVVDSRSSEGGRSVRRRHPSGECSLRLTICEGIEATQVVRKRDGSLVRFSMSEVRGGLGKELANRQAPPDSVVGLVRSRKRRSPRWARGSRVWRSDDRSSRDSGPSMRRPISNPPARTSSSKAPAASCGGWRPSNAMPGCAQQESAPGSPICMFASGDQQGGRPTCVL